MNRHVRVVDLFAGVGGFAVGLRRTADELDLTIEHTAAVDTDDAALQVFAANHNIEPQHAHHSDVGEWLNLVRRGETPTPACDLLVGGPPCQGHSLLNRYKQANDERNDLYHLMADAAIALNAGAVVIENVPNVVGDRGAVVARTEQTLIAAGYHVAMGVLHAHRMGAPQTRRRHFLVARRDKWPSPVTDLELRYAAPPMTAAELLASPLTANPLMLVGRECSGKERERIDYLHDHDVYDLPEHLLPPAARRNPSWGFRRSQGRMRPWLPVPTILAFGSGPLEGRWVHPTERRTVNPAEKAAAQEFPADYEWGEPNATQAARWVGNAVPATLAHAATWLALE